MGNTLGDESVIACVAGVKRRKGEFGRVRTRGAREGERKVALLPPPSRVVSRPNSLPLPFRTPATQAKSVRDSRANYASTRKSPYANIDIASFKVDFHCRVIFPYERA